jgi:hypothetical protein
MKIYKIMLVTWISLTVAACGSAQSTTSPADPTQVPASAHAEIANPSEIPPVNTKEIPPELAGTPEFGITSTPNPDLVEAILIVKTDLSNQLNIDMDQITLLRAVEIIWPDTSLGCPESGKGYAQVLTPGYLIQLEAGGVVYEYHADTKNTLYRCGPGSDSPYPDIPVTPGEIQDGIPWVPVN